MRPVLLDMCGFASFREEARVDFADANFFALVGPTGAGKSTVIDAMTFALYGSVPRWGRKGMVSLALAPTVARGTVKLVFEVDGQRYVVARELRRVGGTVSQRAASLERLADADGLAAPGETTFPLAKDLDGVNDTVEKLLGLKYEDFTQCVVLPQGQFAAFLHAKPAERQDILLRLLGAEHYRLMMAKANQRASVAAQRAATYGEELLGYADATPAAEEAARATEDALAGLGKQVSAALPLIAAQQAALQDADERLRRLRAEGAALSALRVPDGAGRLDADVAASRAAVAGLTAAEQAAEGADTAARDALAAGPQRAPLELARTHRAERARLQASVVGLAADVTGHGTRASNAAAAVETAAAALEESRVNRDSAARAAEAAAARVTALAAEHAKLAAVAVPGGVAELDERRAAVASALTAATADLEEAERAEEASRAARAAAAPEAPLAQAHRDLSDLRSLLADVAAAEHAARQAAAARDAAETALGAAEEARQARQAKLEEARRTHLVAALRPHLVTGEPCPVCEQPVAILPAPLPADEVDAAQAGLAEAEHAVTRAQSAARKAAAAVAKADADLAACNARRIALATGLASVLDGPLAAFPMSAARDAAANLTAAQGPGAAAAVNAAVEGASADAARPRSRRATLGEAAQAAQTSAGARTGDAAGGPGRAEMLASALEEVAGLERVRREAERAAEQAATAAQRVRARQRSAQARARGIEAELTAAQAALRTARDPLVELGAPPAEGASLAEAWAALAGWAGEQVRMRQTALEQTRKASGDADTAWQRLTAEFADKERRLGELRANARKASEDDQRARAQLSQVTARVAELDFLLADAPRDEQITEGLALRDRLEHAAADAEAALRKARAARAQGEKALADLERAEREARGQLSTARDRVVALGAPVLDEKGLLDGWTSLVNWATAQATAREQAAATAGREADTARASIGDLTRELSGELAAAGIDLPQEAVAASAAAAVTGALEGARAVTRRVAERRAQAADLTGKQRTAQEEQQVAHLLGNLLQSRQFPQWLVSEALDDLVTAASATLAALSSGQFDLTHDKGDLYVIDHADADARRSVRTLSGGETFQASLALALALSTQITALAEAGAARLDSIFLDEGFGTLDAETLEVVAATLEALAQGDRMVGVVTHVAELAERVPVRFRVTRNARTSLITREGLAAPATEPELEDV
jgi:DNA repair protein SbcC/Rad50